MSEPIKDGGPIFLHFVKGLPVAGSLTLRDYFAGQALAGNLIEPTANNEQVAKWAYSLADAMLAAREVSHV
jgi:hypothetical protein